MDYTRHITAPTPQSEPLDPSQVQNSAGGFVFQVDRWARLRRFLILGTEGGTYYVSEREATIENAKVVQECIDEDPERAQNLIFDVIDSRKAPKLQPGILALAMLLQNPLSDDQSIRDRLRTASQLMTFVKYSRALRGWGKRLKRLVNDWYTFTKRDKLAYQLVKYRNRDGWTHRDLLRCSHPMPQSHNDDLLAYAAGKPKNDKIHPLVQAFELAQKQVDPHVVADLVCAHRLTWEMLPSEMLKEPIVWKALVPDMPAQALLRNLGRLASLRVDVDPAHVLEKVQTEHPLKILVALSTYKSGTGVKGSLRWNVDPRVVDALDDAFHASFKHLQPTGKRILLALDVSASMASPCALGIPCRNVTAAMAMATARIEPLQHIVGFDVQSGGVDGIKDLGITSRTTIADAIRRTSAWRGGGTDCSLPMTYALRMRLNFDTFIIYTDNETWHGRIHPMEALREYRQATGIDAKLVVVAMTATKCSIADPKDPLCLDIVGMDATVPNLIEEFIK